VLFVVIGVAAYGLSTLAASGPASFRYIFTPVLVALPFATDTIVRLARLTPKWRSVVLVALCGGLLANVAVNASALVRQAPLGTDRLYAANDTLIRAVEDAGYSKGYATFWNANINTYLSGRKVLFLPVTSLGDRAARYDFLVNTPDFDVAARSTFLYVAPGVDEYRPHDKAIEFWTGVLGEPAETTELPTGGTLLFYNRDIGPELPLWAPVAQD
jgi:hypothetical protein